MSDEKKKEEKREPAPPPAPKPFPQGGFHPATGVWAGAFRGGFERYSAVAVVLVSLLAGIVAMAAAKGGASDVRAPGSPENGRTVLLLDGNNRGNKVTFAHAGHIERLGGDASCVECHHVDKPNDPNTACWKCHSSTSAVTPVFRHSRHISRLGGNDACEECHDADGPRWGATAKACVSCHEKDMRMGEGTVLTVNNYRARTYSDAMHGKCAKCHEERAASVNKPGLGECETCHGEGYSAENAVSMR